MKNEWWRQKVVVVCERRELTEMTKVEERRNEAEKVEVKRAVKRFVC